MPPTIVRNDDATRVRQRVKECIETADVIEAFFNLLLLADAHRSWDLSSLKLITYGTEVMSEHEVACEVRLGIELEISVKSNLRRQCVTIHES